MQRMVVHRQEFECSEHVEHAVTELSVPNRARNRSPFLRIVEHDRVGFGVVVRRIVPDAVPKIGVEHALEQVAYGQSRNNVPLCRIRKLFELVYRNDTFRRWHRDGVLKDDALVRASDHKEPTESFEGINIKLTQGVELLG